jgi:hypothetical protein
VLENTDSLHSYPLALRQKVNGGGEKLGKTKCKQKISNHVHLPVQPRFLTTQ